MSEEVLDLYDVSKYAEQDHELVRSVEAMADDEVVVFELQTMDGETLVEDDGEAVEVPLNREEVEQVLSVAQVNEVSVSEAFAYIVSEIETAMMEDADNEQVFDAVIEGELVLDGEESNDEGFEEEFEHDEQWRDGSDLNNMPKDEG